VTYEVEINGRTRQVEIEQGPDGLVVIVDGHRHAADVTPLNGAFSLILDRNSWEVAIHEHPPASGQLTIHVNGRVVPASVGATRGARTRRRDESPAASGPHTVTAPMPGKVVKVLVKPGDAVNARQGVVVVEAMKMENELRSASAGVVKAIHVAPGKAVERGTTLVELT